MEKTAKKFRSFPEAERADPSTKYAALSSLGNLPVVYMIAVDGWIHDRFGTAWMLQVDGISAIVFTVIALLALHKINAAASSHPPSNDQ